MIIMRIGYNSQFHQYMFLEISTLFLYKLPKQTGVKIPSNKFLQNVKDKKRMFDTKVWEIRMYKGIFQLCYL